MFGAWKIEKATAALVDEAEALSEKLAGSKPHVRDSHAANARFWAATYLADGQNLYDLIDWAPPALARFIAKAQTKIAALRKARDYDSSDGLAIWLHTARAVTEPRIAPAARDIWQHILTVGPNADAMADDLLQGAGLSDDQVRRGPKGFGVSDQTLG